MSDGSFISGFVTADTVPQNLGPVPHVEFAFEKQYPRFPNNPRGSHETDPPPRCKKLRFLPRGEGGRIDAVRGGEDAGDEFGMGFGGVEGYGVVDWMVAVVVGVGIEGVRGSKGVGAFTGVEGGDVKIFGPGGGELRGGFCVVVGGARLVQTVFIRIGEGDWDSDSGFFEKVHPPFVEGVIYFQYHCFQLPLVIIQIPERDRVERVTKKSRCGNQVCRGVILWNFSLCLVFSSVDSEAVFRRPTWDLRYASSFPRSPLI